MPEIIEIAVPIEEIEARRERYDKTIHFKTPDRVAVIPRLDPLPAATNWGEFQRLFC